MPTLAADVSSKKWLLLGIIIAIIAGIVIYQYVADGLVRRMTSAPSDENNAALLRKLLAELSPLSDAMSNACASYDTNPKVAALPADERALANFHVIGCRLTGYLADTPEYGIFSEADATRMALSVGMRVLVLEIDYLDADPTTPLLVCRNEAAQLVSNNKGNIAAVATEISRYMSSAAASADPVIVVLSFNRLPQDDTERIKYMAAVAKGLSPLSKIVMRQDEKGVYMNQGMSDKLFLQPISTYDKRVLIFSTESTKIFANPPKGYTVDQASNLDTYVHAVLKADYDKTASADMTGIQTTTTAAYNAPPAFYKDIPTDMIQRYKNMITSTWNISMPHEMVPQPLPSKETLKHAMEKLGVQAHIVDLVAYVRNTAATATANEDVSPIYEDYFKRYSYIPKAEALRYKEPAPTVSAAPSKTMNAGGGVVNLV